MAVLSHLEPTSVFHYFEEICGIPHGSQNVEKISNYLVNFAKEQGLRYRQDDCFNVIIWKDGSAGYENSQPVILQGHMDMVAVKEDSCNKDLTTEGLDLEIQGDFLSAAGTSLGGDDGIAVACGLALLASSTIAHPPIEAVFTVNEEIGMLGADYLDASDLKGRIFLNMDSEDEGIFTVSCAGGVTATCVLPFEKEDFTGTLISFKMDGFTGGHSGVEINKGRVNANIAMARVLMNLNHNVTMRLVEVQGGEKDNAIATFSQASVVVDSKHAKDAVSCIKKVFQLIGDEYTSTDPQMKLSVTTKEDGSYSCLSEKSTKAALALLNNVPNGIQRMNPDIEGMVQTSLNLGILTTTENEIRLSFAARSSSESEKDYLIQKLTELTQFAGGYMELTGNYPGWEYRPDSRLRKVMVQVYRNLYGQEPVVEGIHAGLECGIFASKLEGLDAVSFGPQMHNIHTTNEKLSISSTKRTWELLLKTLEALK